MHLPFFIFHLLVFYIYIIPFGVFNEQEKRTSGIAGLLHIKPKFLKNYKKTVINNDFFKKQFNLI